MARDYRVWWASLSDEAKLERSQKEAQRQRERKFLETPEQREARLLKQRARDRARERTWTPEHRADRLAYRRAWGRRNRQHLGEYERARKVGTTPDDLVRLERLQGMVCALCQDPFPDTRRKHVDHCHRTGRIRGILCAACNTGLGALGDNQEGLQAALDYVNNVKADPDCF